MSMTDPIADMLTRIRNGLRAEKVSVNVPASKMKQAVAQVLKDEGYIAGFEPCEVDGKPFIAIALKYYEGRPVIDRIERVSTPGRRLYRSKNELPSVLGGMGIAIVSTSKGIMTDRAARKSGVGGEVLCYVS
jgi:small subunit ribosomal protein S8